MISPSLAVQKALAACLVPALGGMALVVAASGLPETFPLVQIGGDQEVAADEVARRHVEVFSTLHVWTDEPGMTAAKEIGAAIFGAVRFGLPSIAGVHFHDIRFDGARYMRDPGGKLAHGVITIRTVVEVLP